MNDLTKLTDLRNDCLWRIEKSEDIWYAVDRNGEKTAIINDEAEDLCHGDVIELPQKGKVIRLHDGSSSSALVYVTNQCNSNCIMCPDSVKARTRPNHITYEYLMEYISLLPSDLSHVDITGGEPTLLKYQLLPLIQRMTERAEEAEVLMLSNGRSFADRKYAEKFSVFSNKRFKVEIPVHSAEPGKHDLIAGCPGSFAQTMAGIHHILEAGVEVGIRIVVSRLNYQELNSIIQFIHQEFPAGETKPGVHIGDHQHQNRGDGTAAPGDQHRIAEPSGKIKQLPVCKQSDVITEGEAFRPEVGGIRPLLRSEGRHDQPEDRHQPEHCQNRDHHIQRHRGNNLAPAHIFH